MSDHPAKKFAESFDSIRSEFDKRMADIKSQFGHAKYSDTRCNLIYAAFGEIGMSDMNRIFDHFVGNAKYAPTLEEFEAEISKIKNSKASVEKEKRRAYDVGFFNDEQKMKFFGALADALDAGNTEGIKQAEDALIKAFKLSPGKVSGCRYCSNSGAVTSKRESEIFPGTFENVVAACSCSFGNRYRDSWK